VRRRVGLLSHASHLYDDLTVRENIRFGVRAAAGDPARIDPACERWGLTGRLARTPAAKLSAGQRRRVALAVLTARWPEVWLLDEPHAGLDAAARGLLDEAVAEASAAGVTVLIASHEPGAAEALAHRAVTVTGGRVTAERALRPSGSAPAAAGAGATGTGSNDGSGSNGGAGAAGLAGAAGVAGADEGDPAGPAAGSAERPTGAAPGGAPTSGRVAHVA
jgi:ABC-type nitrate/sulfonate/bicarbonate transport system ATPase subunit